MKSNVSSQTLILIGLFILVFFLRIPSLNQPFENDSASVAYHARLIARGEPLYGTHHTAHHMPGTYYIFALAFRLFGENVSSVRLVLVFWITATVFLIYHVGLLVGGHRSGLIAAIFSAILFSHVGLAGTSAKPELFVNLPRVLSIFLFFFFIKRKVPPKHYFWIGVCNGFTFIFKINYLSPLALTGLVLLQELWLNRKSKSMWSATISKGCWIVFGFLTPLAFVLVYFFHLGLLGRFLEIFRLGFGYIHLVNNERTNPALVIIYPLLILSSNNAVVVITALTNIFFIAYYFFKGQISTTFTGFPVSAERYLVLWFGLCFLETSVSRTYLVYYYIVYVPALTLLFSIFLEKTIADLYQAGQTKSALTVFTLMVSTSLCFSFYANYKYYWSYTRYATGQTDYQTFLNNGLPDGVGRTISNLQEIASYITNRTSANDTIYYWSSLMDLYFMLDRRSSYEIIWPYYAGALGNREQIFTATYFMVGDNSLGIKRIPQWLISGLAENYTLETIMYGQYIYHRK